MEQLQSEVMPQWQAPPNWPGAPAGFIPDGRWLPPPDWSADAQNHLWWSYSVFDSTPRRFPAPLLPEWFSKAAVSNVGLGPREDQLARISHNISNIEARFFKLNAIESTLHAAKLALVSEQAEYSKLRNRIGSSRRIDRYARSYFQTAERYIDAIVNVRNSLLRTWHSAASKENLDFALVMDEQWHISHKQRSDFAAALDKWSGSTSPLASTTMTNTVLRNVGSQLGTIGAESELSAEEFQNGLPIRLEMSFATTWASLQRLAHLASPSPKVSLDGEKSNTVNTPLLNRSSSPASMRTRPQPITSAPSEPPAVWHNQAFKKADNSLSHLPAEAGNELCHTEDTEKPCDSSEDVIPSVRQPVPTSVDRDPHPTSTSPPVQSMSPKLAPPIRAHSLDTSQRQVGASPPRAFSCAPLADSSVESPKVEARAFSPGHITSSMDAWDKSRTNNQPGGVQIGIEVCAQAFHADLRLTSGGHVWIDFIRTVDGPVSQPWTGSIPTVPANRLLAIVDRAVSEESFTALLPTNWSLAITLIGDDLRELYQPADHSDSASLASEVQLIIESLPRVPSEPLRENRDCKQAGSRAVPMNDLPASDTTSHDGQMFTTAPFSAPKGDKTGAQDRATLPSRTGPTEVSLDISSKLGPRQPRKYPNERHLPTTPPSSEISPSLGYEVKVIESQAEHSSRDPDLLSQSEANLNLYVQQIRRIVLLRADEEVDLARRIEAGLWAEQKMLATEGADQQLLKDLRFVAKDGRDSFNRLVESNLRLVVSIARKYAGRGMALLDLIQEGNTGLIRAVEKFDFALGFKFSTYATWWIRQAVTRGLADQGRTIRLPAHMIELISKIEQFCMSFRRDEERDPVPQEIAKALSLSERDVLRAMRHASTSHISLDTVIHESGILLKEVIVDFEAPSPLDLVSYALLSEQIHSVLGTFPEREAGVIAMRHGLINGEQMTLDQIGKIYGVTRERIRQIESKTMTELRLPPRSDLLLAYLQR